MKRSEFTPQQIVRMTIVTYESGETIVVHNYNMSNKCVVSDPLAPEEVLIHIEEALNLTQLDLTQSTKLFENEHKIKPAGDC